MRLSLRKAAHAAISSAAWQENRVRSDRDDKVDGTRFVQRWVLIERTAGPSAALGMTKWRAHGHLSSRYRGMERVARLSAIFVSFGGPQAWPKAA